MSAPHDTLASPELRAAPYVRHLEGALMGQRIAVNQLALTLSALCALTEPHSVPGDWGTLPNLNRTDLAALLRLLTDRAYQLGAEAHEALPEALRAELARGGHLVVRWQPGGPLEPAA